MTDKIIPAGYQLEISSWENDADHWNEKTIQVKPDQINDYLGFIKLFKAELNDGGLSNIYDPSGREIEQIGGIVRKFFETHPNAYTTFEVDVAPEDDEEFADLASDIAYDLGLSGLCDDQWSRHLESVTVYFVPTEITLRDVTKDFL